VEPPNTVLGYVYLITNIVNGKQYVGYTTQTIRARWVQHKSAAKCGSSTVLHKAIRKHGPGNFRLDTIEIVDGTITELKETEVRQIAAHGCVVPRGYNLTHGGEGVDFLVTEVRQRHLAGVRARSANPVWQKNVTEAGRRRASDPQWQQNHAAAALRRKADPKWQEKHAEHLRRMHADLSWQKANAEGARKRSANPEWRHNVAEAALRRAADPKCQKKLVEGCRRRSANSDYRQKLMRGIRQRSEDPTWKVSLLKGAQTRLADPGWRKANEEQRQRQQADPKWQEARAGGLRKAWAASAMKAAARDAHFPPKEQARRARRREQSRKYKAEKRAHQSAISP
jgi:group I intron endonuclease